MYSSDKRGHRRMTLDCEVHIEVIDGESPRSIVGTCLDLSATGVQCLLDEPLEVDTMVKIHIASASASIEPFNALGQVLRCRQNSSGQYKAGLKLIDVH